MFSPYWIDFKLSMRKCSLGELTYINLAERRHYLLLMVNNFSKSTPVQCCMDIIRVNCWSDLKFFVLPFAFAFLSNRKQKQYQSIYQLIKSKCKPENEG